MLIVSLLVTLGATYFFYQNSQSKDKTRFATEVNKSRTILETKINSYITMLKSIRAFIEAEPNANKEEFSVFVKNLEMQNSYTGVQGLGYVSIIPPEKRQEITGKMNAVGKSDFKLFPESSVGENSYVVVYSESFTGNNQPVGFDMSSEPIMLQTMNYARDSGEIAASGKVMLMMPDKDASHPGFLFYLPVYGNGGIPQSLEDRRPLLKGFVYSPFRAEEFLYDVQKTIASNYLAISVYDGEVSQERILASTSPSEDSLFSTTNEIDVAGRKWIVEYNSLPDFETQSSTNLTPLVFISGAIFSLILFGITYLESYARARAEKNAFNLKQSESDKAELLKSEQRARAAAESANHAKDEFIANVSHELRTPLNSIAGWSRILQSENLPSGMRKQALQKIDKNLRVQTKIIEDLLDFSQITTGQPLVGTQPIKLSDVFEEAFLEIVPSAKEKRITLEKHNSLNGQKVYGDYPHLKKVIKNLLSNAVKFTNDGGKIVAEARENQSMVELKIADSGKGIDPSFLPYIFEAFKQADSSITRSHGGLGMGLTISRQIIKSYGGEIEVESEGEGKGTVFLVKLPYITG